MNNRTLYSLLAVFIACTGYGQAVKKVKPVGKLKPETTEVFTEKQITNPNPVVRISATESMYLANSSLNSSFTTSEPFSPGQQGKISVSNAAKDAAKAVQTANSQVTDSPPKSPTLADQLNTKGPQKYSIAYMPAPVYTAWKASLDDLIYMNYYQQVAVNVSSDEEMEQKIAGIRSTIINDMFNAEHNPNYQSSDATFFLGYKALRSFGGSQAPFKILYMDPRLIYEASLWNILDKWTKDGVLTKEGFLSVVGLKTGIITVN